jgi:peptidoglycan/xylan/chitin deacetylase (PgdA/CDA1 family)
MRNFATLVDWERDSRSGVPILMYHHIGRCPHRSRLQWLFYSPKGFRRMMHDLIRDGFQTVSIDDALGGQQPGARRFVITFDDGYESALKYAADFLRGHKLAAIQFLVADFLGRTNEWDSGQRVVGEPLMDRKQVQEWLSLGHEIGAHTLTHPRLSQIPIRRAREEIHSSKKKLEDLFGVPVRHFAYPYGDRNPEVVAIVKEAGFCTACTTDPGFVQAGDHPLQLRRLTAQERIALRWAALRVRNGLRRLASLGHVLA